MLSFYLMFYLIFKNKFIKNKVGKWWIKSQ
jgi:hypothetical protein